MKKVGGIKIIFPDNPNLIKRECHRIMLEIWGNGSHKQGYLWLNKRFNRTIHFSQINDVLFLKEIYRALWFHQAKLEDELLNDHI